MKYTDKSTEQEILREKHLNKAEMAMRELNDESLLISKIQ